jgi:hypothetical protein
MSSNIPMYCIHMPELSIIAYLAQHVCGQYRARCAVGLGIPDSVPRLIGNRNAPQQSKMAIDTTFPERGIHGEYTFLLSIRICLSFNLITI